MKSQLIKKPWPYFALFIAHLIWGVNFVVAKVTLQEFPPMSLAFLRFAFASLLLAPFFYAFTQKSAHRKVKFDKKDLPKLVAIGVLIITLNISFFFEGIKRTTVVDASILALAVPMLSVLMGWWFLKERIFLINLAGIVLGFLGAFIIIGGQQIVSGNLSPERLMGNILIILAAVSWVAGAIIAKNILKKYPSLVLTAIVFLVGTITFFIPALMEYIKDPSWPYQVTTLGVFGLIYMTLLSSISAYFLFEWGLSKTSVGTADLFQYIEPFIATSLAVIILGETISTYFYIGALLIGVGVYLGTFAKEAHHRHHKFHRT